MCLSLVIINNLQIAKFQLKSIITNNPINFILQSEFFMGCAQVVNHSNEIFEPIIERRSSKKTTAKNTTSCHDSPIIFPLNLPDGFGKYKKNPRNTMSKTKLRNTMRIEIQLDSSKNTILQRRTISPLV
ncbi:unnamed protein product [Paramecium sonneborni]|uniref:Uncharacterized protein n=1 Tax=Paramecium sonneborni TaxID=65129 RepID=A0A8S1QGE0_9CILI|nr:unnamed protein product [Paramecium sonneborni]